MKRLLGTFFLALAFCAGISAQTVRAFGDSIIDGSGTTIEAQKARNIIGSGMGVSVVNFSHGGDMTGELNAIVNGVTVGAGDVSIIGIGTNDARINASSATKRGYSKDGLRNAVMRLALVNKQNARAVGGETGTWTNTGIEGIGRATSTIGATKTFTGIAGTVVYVGVIIVDTAGGAGTYEVRVDGALMGSYDANAPGVTSYNGYAYNNRLHRYAGLASGTHSIEVKMTGASNLYVQWAGGNTQTIKPKVYVANIQRPWPAYTWGGSSTSLADHNTDWAAIVSDAVSDGSDVVLVDVRSALNDSTDLHPADGLHLSAPAGNLKYANTFLAAAGLPAARLFTPLGSVMIRDDDLLFIVTPSGAYKQIATLP